MDPTLSQPRQCVACCRGDREVDHHIDALGREHLQAPADRNPRALLACSERVDRGDKIEARRRENRGTHGRSHLAAGPDDTDTNPLLNNAHGPAH